MISGRKLKFLLRPATDYFLLDACYLLHPQDEDDAGSVLVESAGRVDCSHHGLNQMVFG